MRLFAFFMATAVVLAALSGTLAGQSPTIVIRDVHLIDVMNHEVVEHQAIVLAGDRIEAVVPAAELAVPDGATVIEGAGQYAIPGLWDMHIHWYHQLSMALFPINGVTGVRVMFGSPMHHAWRKSFDDGTRLGPRMLIGSAIIDGPRPIWPGSIIAADAEGGKLAVEKAIAAKADFAKVYSLLSRDAYFAVLEEARLRGLPVDGHVPMVVSVGEVSEAGQRCMEHLYEVILSCSSREEELREMQRECIGEDGNVRNYYEDRELQKRIGAIALESFDNENAARLFQQLAKNGTWQCPTLTVNRNLARLSKPEIQQNENLKYIPRSMRATIVPSGERANRDEETERRGEVRFQKLMELLGQMHKAGVPIVAGTDCLNPYCLPGFSLHTELELLVEAGLSPGEALSAATINAAEMVGKESEWGTIEPGKVADLVLLNDNPLTDIRNSTKIESVFLRGRHLPRAELDELLESFRAESP